MNMIEHAIDRHVWAVDHMIDHRVMPRFYLIQSHGTRSFGLYLVLRVHVHT